MDKVILKELQESASQSTCDRGMIGALLDHNGRHYHGHPDSPIGCPSCKEVGHLIISGHCNRTIHAEENAIYDAIQHGDLNFKDMTLYVTHVPCFHCTNVIIQYGIRNLIILKDSWNNPNAIKYLDESPLNYQILDKGE